MSSGCILVWNTNRHVHISESIAAQTREEVRNSSRNCANQSTFLSALGIINKRRWCKSWWGLMKPESNRSWIFLEFLWIVKERRIGVWKWYVQLKNRTENGLVGILLSQKVPYFLNDVEVQHISIWVWFLCFQIIKTLLKVYRTSEMLYNMLCSH